MKTLRSSIKNPEIEVYVNVYLFLRILLFLYKKPRNIFIRRRRQKTQKCFHTYKKPRNIFIRTHLDDAAFVRTWLPASVLLLSVLLNLIRMNSIFVGFGTIVASHTFRLSFMQTNGGKRNSENCSCRLLSQTIFLRVCWYGKNETRRKGNDDGKNLGTI